MGSLGWEVRGSILAFVAVTLLLVGVEAVHGFLGSLDPQQMPKLLLPTSYTVAAVSAGLGWLSPYGHLSRALNLFYAQDWRGYGLSAGLALLYDVLLLVLARYFSSEGVTNREALFLRGPVVFGDGSEPRADSVCPDP